MTPARRFGMFFSSLICGWVKTFIRRPSPADREGHNPPGPGPKRTVRLSCHADCSDPIPIRTILKGVHQDARITMLRALRRDPGVAQRDRRTAGAPGRPELSTGRCGEQQTIAGEHRATSCRPAATTDGTPPPGARRTLAACEPGVKYPGQTRPIPDTLRGPQRCIRLPVGKRRGRHQGLVAETAPRHHPRQPGVPTAQRRRHHRAPDEGQPCRLRTLRDDGR
jgi:hypothetical protein